MIGPFFLALQTVCKDTFSLNILRSKRNLQSCKDEGGTDCYKEYCAESSEHFEWTFKNCKKTCDFCEADAALQVKDVCEDSVKDCVYWAGIGECEANPIYMLKECRLSCKVCVGTSGSCADAKTDVDGSETRCGIWKEFCTASDDKESERFALYMERYCKKTCGKCEPDAVRPPLVPDAGKPPLDNPDGVKPPLDNPDGVKTPLDNPDEVKPPLTEGEGVKPPLDNSDAVKPPLDNSAGQDQSTPAPTTPDTTSNQFEKELLECHNIARCLAGVPLLTWDPKLADNGRQVAEQFANHAPDKHPLTLNEFNVNLGENIWEGSMDPTGMQACQPWWDEGKDYPSPSAGHYTSMIWKTAKKMGCGKTTGGLGYKVVCKYDSGEESPGPNAGEKGPFVNDGCHASMESCSANTTSKMLPKAFCAPQGENGRYQPK